ncbi:MAG: double zinc ribbon domain-containing protein [Promethearchaeota archaeon]
MSKETDSILNHCVYCGAILKEQQIYCPECGKLLPKIKRTTLDVDKQKKPSETKKVCPKCGESAKPNHLFCMYCGHDLRKPFKPDITSLAQEKVEISRKCSGCGSIITSIILEQCPICNAPLEKIPESQKIAAQRPSGLVFTDDSYYRERYSSFKGSRYKYGLVPEENLAIRKDTWNLKEGVNLFTNCLMIYITIELLLIIVLWMSAGPEDPIEIELNMYLILLSQIPGIVIGIYPIWYIYSNKHESRKLGLYSGKKKLLIALLIGIGGSIVLLFINLGTTFLFYSLYEKGIGLIDLQAYYAEENQIIREAELVWIIMLFIFLTLQAISLEIVYRGVLHNTLKERFSKDSKGKLKVILSVALIYAVFSILFTFPIGILFFPLNIIMFIFLGALYEINGNLWNTIIAHVAYQILILILILYFYSF